ncbi:Cellular retinaldehyde-binding/triple function, C-terminal [Zostera marina]|uniref:Cellular retinaldehyde-binding/triple function, C-terminal n=1 Tax=Zostera marina TaxID=29655 RepID=A0A0K9PIY9_ZOSMR|nr:Cellular retinaldehyde-binding/triple function, C-terminal [Zostera marina]
MVMIDKIVSHPASGDSDVTKLLDEREVFACQGKDKRGRRIVRIVGKFFPAKVVKEEDLRKYLEMRIFPKLVTDEGDVVPFCLVYVHTRVQKSENFLGFSSLRSIYEELPTSFREKLESVYFVHPGLQSRLFLATVGRFLFSSGLYRKVIYIGRLEFLWIHVKEDGELEIPEFVFDHDDALEYRPLMDYGIEKSNYLGYYDETATVDCSISSIRPRSLRCIS